MVKPRCRRCVELLVDDTSSSKDAVLSLEAILETYRRVVDGVEVKLKIANIEGLYEKREPHAKSPDFQYCIPAVKGIERSVPSSLHTALSSPAPSHAFCHAGLTRRPGHHRLGRASSSPAKVV